MKKIFLIALIVSGVYFLTGCSEHYEADTILFDFNDIYTRLNYTQELEYEIFQLDEERYIFYESDDRSYLELAQCSKEKDKMITYIGVNYKILPEYENNEEFVAFYLKSGELVEIEFLTSSCFFRFGTNTSTLYDSKSKKYVVINPIPKNTESFLKEEKFYVTKEEIYDFYSEFDANLEPLYEEEKIIEDDDPVQKNIGDLIGYRFTYIDKKFQIIFKEIEDKEKKDKCNALRKKCTDYEIKVYEN